MTMFERFLSAYALTDAGSPEERPGDYQTGWQELMGAHAGSTFEGGLYRIHTPTSRARAMNEVSAGYPGVAQRMVLFGYDWLGSQFGIDTTAAESESVRMIEPGTGEILQIPMSFVDFHNSELVDQRDAVVAFTFFNEWIATNPDALPLGSDRCVGYRVPLFLGGRDELANLEETDLWAYLSISAQLIAQTRGLAPGTAISRIRVE